jgi:hypothetical protein
LKSSIGAEAIKKMLSEMDLTEERDLKMREELIKTGHLRLKGKN